MAKKNSFLKFPTALFFIQLGFSCPFFSSYLFPLPHVADCGNAKGHSLGIPLYWLALLSACTCTHTESHLHFNEAKNMKYIYMQSTLIGDGYTPLYWLTLLSACTCTHTESNFLHLIFISMRLENMKYAVNINRRSLHSVSLNLHQHAKVYLGGMYFILNLNSLIKLVLVNFIEILILGTYECMEVILRPRKTSDIEITP